MYVKTIDGKFCMLYRSLSVVDRSDPLGDQKDVPKSLEVDLAYGELSKSVLRRLAQEKPISPTQN